MEIGKKLVQELRDSIVLTERRWCVFKLLPPSFVSRSFLYRETAYNYFH